MATANQEHQTQLRQLAELILAVAGESVTVMKRNAPERALKLKRHEEWSIYLEFLKVMFNLTDRLSALHIPIKDQLEFMNGLEDAVTAQLKNVLEPAFGSSIDQTEIMLTVGAAVAESRQTYERYQFLVTENNPVKDEMLENFGGRVADAMGIAGNAQVSSAATLCASAVIPAIKAILAGDTPPVAAVGTAAPVATVAGEEVETRWGLHPRFRQDLPPEDMQRVAKLMNRVAKILGERYASVAFSDEWTSWHKAGHA